MHKTPTLAQLSTPRCAQARTVAVSWPLARPCRGQGRPCRSLHSRVAARAPQRPSSYAPALACTPRAPRRTCTPPAGPARPVIIQNIVLRYKLAPVMSLAIQSYNTTESPQPLNIAIHLDVLQYNSTQPTALSIAIQSKPCNTIWAVAKFQIFAPNFIFLYIFFHYYYYFSFISRKNKKYIYT